MTTAKRGGIDGKRAGWTRTLKHIRSRPLSLCPDFPDIARRFNRWWNFDADRPLFLAAAAKTPDIRWDKAFDLLDRPEDWLQVRRAQLEALHVAGDWLPSIRIDIGPVAMAAFLGAPLHLAHREQTSWQDPVISDWSRLPPLAALPRLSLHLARTPVPRRRAARDALLLRRAPGRIHKLIRRR